MKILFVVALSLLLFNPVMAQAPISPVDVNTTSTMYLSVSPEIRSLIGKTDATFEAIAYCESHNDPKAKNKNSSASGRLQILKGTWEQWAKEYWGDEWKTKDIFDYATNTELAFYAYKKYGTKPWLSSSQCWLHY